MTLDGHHPTEGWRAGRGGVAREIGMRSIVGDDGCGGWS